MAAERPDAAQQPWDKALRAAALAVGLLGVVDSVFVYCVWSPLAGRRRAGVEAATESVVADAPAEVRAPDVNGVCRAARPLSGLVTGSMVSRAATPVGVGGLITVWRSA